MRSNLLRGKREDQPDDPRRERRCEDDEQQRNPPRSWQLVGVCGAAYVQSSLPQLFGASSHTVSERASPNDMFSGTHANRTRDAPRGFLPPVLSLSIFFPMQTKPLMHEFVGHGAKIARERVPRDLRPPDVRAAPTQLRRGGTRRQSSPQLGGHIPRPPAPTQSDRHRGRESRCLAQAR